MTENKTTTAAPRNKPAGARRSKRRPEPAELVREDDPSDPDNGDPAGWPEWTDRHAYTITR